ncbi:acyl-CoA N-acyltransferase [Crassisporium funariophilum]|nr:acyl-CoA N-acyltransferase [Crassisporium funariophilum]
MLDQTANEPSSTSASLPADIEENTNKGRVTNNANVKKERDIHPSGTRIRVRRYRPSDSEPVRELFKVGMGYGAGSPRILALKATYTAPLSLMSYSISTLGILLAARASSNRNKYLGVGLSLAGCAFVAAYRQLMSNGYLSYINASLNDDLKDIAQHYEMKPIPRADDKDTVEYAPSGTSCFWVAEAYPEDFESGPNAEVVGSIALDASTAPDDNSIAELRRMVVSPTQRRRGVAGMLVQTLIDHARNHGIKTVTLTTSSYQPTAVLMYEKFGWVLQKKLAISLMLDKITLLVYNLDVTKA